MLYCIKKMIGAVLVLGFLITKAQTKTSFLLIDKRVKTINASAADTLAKKLTAPYKKEEEKARAIFRWITEHISYDVIAYHNVDGTYPGLWESSISDNVEERKKIYNSKIVAKVLKERRAVCDGYSRLFKTLCDHANIKCEIITGYIRWSSDPIGAVTKRAHAWNAVSINSKWKLVDVTWASGYCNDKTTVFTKRYDDFFFFSDPIAFFNDHFPTDAKWSLLPATPTLSQFYNYPFFHPDFYRSGIYWVKPTTGYINVKKWDKLATIEFETVIPKKEISIYEHPFVTDTSASADDNSKYIIDKNRVVASYKVLSDKAEKIRVYLNNKLILTYGLKYVN